MKLTVIIADIGAPCNVGGPVTYRRVTVDLTPEQARSLTLRDPKWECYGTTLIEPDEAGPEGDHEGKDAGPGPTGGTPT